MTITLLPDTTKAFLPSAGLKERRATLHVFDHSSRQEKPKTECTVHWFRCTETGTLRIWGCEG